MKLKALIRNLILTVKGSKEIEITGLSSDSKTVAPGNLFIAKRGEKVDGAQFIPHAVRAGAVALVTDLYDPSYSMTQLIVDCPEEWEAKLASRFYGSPSKELFVVGTTGTKGKTTSAYLIYHLLGKTTGLIGTVETIIGTERRASHLTTHFPIQNQKLLREMVSKGCDAVSLEVSSHGLEQNRVGEIEFDVALFTNLFLDHLDYHKTMDAYRVAKRRLFHMLDESSKKNKRALLNADSSDCSFMREGLQTPCWTFGIDQDADIRASDLRFDEQGTSFVVAFNGKKTPFFIPLMGRFNVYNALGAIGVGLHRGLSLEQIAESLRGFQAAPGRLEQVRNDKGIQVFVDFAHNGEALENVLKTLREVAKKKIYCVFGCGGNREPTRRTEMGKAADSLADVSIVTTDNPRQEDPSAIIQQILSSYRKPEQVIVEPDRKAAIYRAIELAQAGDIVLIAGKGHEKTQIFAHQTIPFDDVAIANEALKNS